MKRFIAVTAAVLLLALAGCATTGFDPAGTHPDAWEATKESGHANSIGS